MPWVATKLEACQLTTRNDGVLPCTVLFPISAVVNRVLAHKEPASLQRNAGPAVANSQQDASAARGEGQEGAASGRPTIGPPTRTVLEAVQVQQEMVRLTDDYLEQ